MRHGGGRGTLTLVGESLRTPLVLSTIASSVLATSSIRALGGSTGSTAVEPDGETTVAMGLTGAHNEVIIASGNRLLAITPEPEDPLVRTVGDFSTGTCLKGWCSRTLLIGTILGDILRHQVSGATDRLLRSRSDHTSRPFSRVHAGPDGPEMCTVTSATLGRWSPGWNPLELGLSTLNVTAAVVHTEMVDDVGG